MSRADAVRDRSALLRMAGNIAAGLVQAKPVNQCFTREDLEGYPKIVAQCAVAIASAIVDEVDRYLTPATDVAKEIP